jgi:hypothetical protein
MERREADIAELADGRRSDASVPAAGGGAAAALEAVEMGDELVVEVLTPVVRVVAGERGTLDVVLRNTVAGEIRGEAQLISPYDTWPITSPWTSGFVVGPGEETRLSFRVEPPSDFRPGSYWALVKVMYFGRLHYSEAAVLETVAPSQP